MTELLKQNVFKCEIKELYKAQVRMFAGWKFQHSGSCNVEIPNIKR